MRKIYRYTIPALIIFGVLAMTQGSAFPGGTFGSLLAALICFGAAFLQGLFIPYKSQGMRQAAKIMKRVTAAAMVAATVLFAVVEYKIISKDGGNPVEDAGTVIVLGAGLNGRTPSLVLQSRLDAAVEYLSQNTAAAVILTGGMGENELTTEALAMEKYLLERGIDKERIYLEEEAHNTAQNIKFSKQIIDEEGLAGPIMVISNDFHLYRAEELCNRCGLEEIYTLSAPTPNVFLLKPAYYLREFFSVLLMNIKNVVGEDE